MVSSIRFYSGKDVNLRKAVPFWVVVMIAFAVVAIVQIADNLPEVLFSLFLVYAASGYVMWIVQFTSRRKARQEPPPARQEPGPGL
jgi:CDP-diacylglycerol--serine O-phosphatidyltransferase